VNKIVTMMMTSAVAVLAMATPAFAQEGQAMIEFSGAFGVGLTVILNILGDTVFISAAGSYLFVSFWSFWVALAVTIGVSLVTPRKTNQELEGLVYGSVVTSIQVTGSKITEEPND
jgi:hypothetical protein